MNVVRLTKTISCLDIRTLRYHFLRPGELIVSIGTLPKSARTFWKLDRQGPARGIWDSIGDDPQIVIAEDGEVKLTVETHE